MSPGPIAPTPDRDRVDEAPTGIVGSVTERLAAGGLGDSRAAPEMGEPTVVSGAPDTASEPGPPDPASLEPQTPEQLPTPLAAEIDGGTEPRRRTRIPRHQRISKWDRPPDPHDWRFFVGGLGKVLIATGLLMFGFVAYQLWGTGIETARAQSALKNEFQELIAQRQSTTTPVVVDPGRADGLATDDSSASTSNASTDDVSQADDDSSEPAATADEPPSARADESNTDDSGGPATALPDQPLVPVEQDIPPIFRGDPLALLEIPAIGRSDIVVPGVSLNDLKDGPGHYPETPLPGQLGNASIAGHRTTYGAPFFDVDDLVPGDEIIVTMLTGDRFVYEVTGTEIVSASAYWVVTTTDPTRAELTLTSCHPKYTALDRIVVHSVLNPEKSSNVGFPTEPYVLDGDDDQPIPGDDPVVVADGVEPGPADPADQDNGSMPGGDTIGDEGTGSDESPARPADEGPAETGQLERSVPIADATADPPEVGDAFSQGWFDDRSAFPQIALWGIALTLISIGAYLISRRFRHDSIGFLVGIAPFLFALYFFFQNVNRLLPPGL